MTDAMASPILPEDSDFIVQKLVALGAAQSLKGKHLLVTGGTGFFGKWLTQGLVAANDQLELGAQFTLVSRSPERALNEMPWLKGRKNIAWQECDIRALPSHLKFDMILHGATAASRALNEGRPDEMFDTIVRGTQSVLDVARNGCSKFLFVSSGAVYGAQPEAVLRIGEDYMGAPDPLAPAAAYGEAKRAAELLCAATARSKGFDCGIARCYAFAGPYLPLDTHFAAGNFMQSVLQGKPIVIGGDGTPHRSYLYPADLVVWLMTILLKSSGTRAYNVGSDQSVTIAELARIVYDAACERWPDLHKIENPIQIQRDARPGQRTERYVPSIQRAREELGLDVWTDLQSTFSKTLRWHDNADKERMV